MLPSIAHKLVLVCLAYVAIPVAVPEPSVPASVSTVNMSRDVSQTLQAVIARRHVPGLAAVVLKGDRIVAEGAAGVRKLGAPQPIAMDDSFMLCSGTKAMTATLAAMAVEEGKLSWHSTIGEILGNTFPHMRPEWRSVTLLELLEHRGGVPGDMDEIRTLLWTHLVSRGGPSEKRRKIIASVLSHPPRYRPGSTFLYSSIGYFVISSMLEKATGLTWEDAIAKMLWAPLGINTGGEGSPGSGSEVTEPWGHAAGSSLFHGRAIAPGSFWGRLTAPAFFGPGGTAHMSIVDWSKFISLHLRGDPANPHTETRLIQSSSFAVLHQSPAGQDYQSGWFVATHKWAKGDLPGDSGRVLRSLGDSGYWHVDAEVAPEIDFAVVCAVNQGGAEANQPASLACNDVTAAMVKDF